MYKDCTYCRFARSHSYLTIGPDQWMWVVRSHLLIQVNGWVSRAAILSHNGSRSMGANPQKSTDARTALELC